MPFRRWPFHRRVMASLVSGDAMTGLLVACRGTHLVLAQAHLHSPSAETVPLDGEVYIERPKVLFLQVLPPEEV